MPQNWWELFPEIQPSPAARPRPLPGPGGATLGLALGPGANMPYGALGPTGATNGGDSFFLGGDADDQLSHLGVDEHVYFGPGDASAIDIGADELGRLHGQQALPAGEAVANKGSALAAVKSGNDPKGQPPVSPPRFHGSFSAPHTGGPVNPVQPHRSYSVPVHRPGGGLNGYGYAPQPADAQLLARLIYAESGITPGDMPAIGWAAVNRVGFPHNAGPAFGSTLSQVVYQPARHGRYQYSFLNDGGSPEWHDSADPSNIPAAGRAKWARAVAVANAILSGRVPDPSGGAQYFFASPDYVPGRYDTARWGFPPMLQGHRIAPTPYQSTSTARDHGRLTRNYFFRENPEKLWLPDPPRRGRH